jgi:hypothetical protein
MTKLFLSLRHWQLFAILYLPLIVVEVMTTNGALSPTTAALGPCITVLLFLWWCLSVAITFAKSNDQFERKTVALKIAVGLIVIYLFVSFYLFTTSMTKIPSHVLLHGLFVILYTYCLSVVAKIIRSLKHRREARSSEYQYEILWLFLFPIGLWFIQPFVNKRLADQKM